MRRVADRHAVPQHSVGHVDEHCEVRVGREFTAPGRARGVSSAARRLAVKSASAAATCSSRWTAGAIWRSALRSMSSSRPAKLSERNEAGCGNRNLARSQGSLWFYSAWRRGVEPRDPLPSTLASQLLYSSGHPRSLAPSPSLKCALPYVSEFYHTTWFTRATQYDISRMIWDRAVQGIRRTRQESVATLD